MCEFQSLYFEDDGYIIRCKQCGLYQVAFISTMITLNETDFHALRKLVGYKCEEADLRSLPHSKSIRLNTPSPGIYMVLTRNEASRLGDILELADNEVKALSLMNLFNP